MMLTGKVNAFARMGGGEALDLYLPEAPPPLIVSFGGGTNSTGMLCGFLERGIVPEAIFFADTGGEMPRTYAHVEEMNEKCLAWWGVEITTVRKLYRGGFEGLEGECLRCKQLPSLAYGGKHCSVKYKAEPQDRATRYLMAEKGWTVTRKAIGFGSDEPWRVKPKYDVVALNRKRQYRSWYPLVEWGWRRVDCIEAIARHGLSQPGKSSCFFCPAKKRGEVLKLRAEIPELFERGLGIEAAASQGRRAPNGGEGIQGLHFGVKWSDMAQADDEQGKLFDWIGEHASAGVPCGCYDG